MTAVVVAVIVLVGGAVTLGVTVLWPHHPAVAGPAASGSPTSGPAANGPGISGDPSGGLAAPPPGPDSPTSPSDQADPGYPAWPSATYSPVPTGSAGSADQELDAQAAGDHDRVEGLVGSWVPQLSSKAVGTTANGVTYDSELILRDFRTTAAGYPAAVLLRSGDFRSFTLRGYWVTVVATPFPTAAQANAWCDSAGLDAAACFAKRLSHTDGPQGTTVQR